MKYRYFYLCYGIKYTDPRSISNENHKDPMYNWQKELCEQLEKISKEGWDLVQISDDLITGKACDGYGLFKKE